MSQYTKSTNFATKDNLTPGDPLKVVRGTEIDTEFNNIATAIATKTDNSAAAITGGAIDGATVGATTPATGSFTTLAASGTTTLAGALVGAVTQSAFNTVSTTLNLGGAATAVNLGAATGTATVNNTTLAAKAITASTTLAVTGTSTLTGAVTATAGVTGPITSSSVAITGGSITGITDLAVADGGTGASTAAGGLNNLLPSQTGNANKYLQTDGTNATWDAVSLSTADITGTLGVANGGTGVTTSTGTTNVVLSNSPTLVTPALGTPSSAVLTNATGLPISTGVSGLGTGVATLLATPSSANLASAITDETGTGSLVFATSPTLVTPALGTPASGVLTNATGLPISTGVSGLGTGVATFLATPSSANLAAALTDETGSGANVFATSPTLVTPILGTPTSATLTNATGLPISTGVSGLGTGIATALAVNTGSAGAPVLFNGALGTPSGGTVTNLTGTASININGTVGATTATTGAFTSLTASTTLGVTGVSTLTGGAVVEGLTVGRGGGGVATNIAVGASAFAANTTGIGNVAIGQQALNSNTTGQYSAAVGNQALYTNNGSANNAFGSVALYSNTSGILNNAFGNVALNANTTGSFNTAMGHQSLALNTTASNNTAVGYQAAYSNQTGTYITAIGYQAGYSTTVPLTAIGYQTLYANSTGTNNVAIGGPEAGNAVSAMRFNTTGSFNTALGNGALGSNLSASNNTAVGYQAAYSNTTGQHTVVGKGSLYSTTVSTGNAILGYDCITSGSATTNVQYNTAIGNTSLQALQNGATYNTAVGYGAGSAITTGAKNSILGAYNGNQGSLDIRTASNYIVLSDGDGNATYVATYNGSSNFRLNNTTYYTMDTDRFHPQLIGGVDGTQALGNSNRRWSVVYAVTGTINTSDANQKQDIANLDDAEKRVAISIKSLIKKYRFKDAVAKKGDGARIHVGLIAQEVQAAFVAEGLDPARYALFCSDTWYEVNGLDVDAEGKPYKSTNQGAVAITRLGLRYDELLAFVIAAL